MLNLRPIKTQSAIIKYAMFTNTMITPPKNLPNIIWALEIGLEISKSADPFSSAFGIKLEAENIDKNKPPPNKGATTKSLSPFTISPAIFIGSSPFAFTIPLKSSKGTNPNSSAKIIITKVEIAKNVTIIFLDNASLTVRFDIANILFILIFIL